MPSGGAGSNALKYVLKEIYLFISYRKYICYCGYRPGAQPSKCGQLFDPQSGCSRSFGGCSGDAPGGRLRGTSDAEI